MVEYVKATGNIQLQCRRNAGSFRLRLLQQFVVKVAQDRHFLRYRVSKIVPVHIPYGAVNNRLIYGLQALFAANDKLAEGKDKIAFQCKGAVVLAVIKVHIHRVHILGRTVHAFSGWG